MEAADEAVRVSTADVLAHNEEVKRKDAELRWSLGIEPGDRSKVVITCHAGHVMETLDSGKHNKPHCAVCNTKIAAKTAYYRCVTATADAITPPYHYECTTACEACASQLAAPPLDGVRPAVSAHMKLDGSSAAPSRDACGATGTLDDGSADERAGSNPSAAPEPDSGVARNAAADAADAPASSGLNGRDEAPTPAAAGRAPVFFFLVVVWEHADGER